MANFILHKADTRGRGDFGWLKTRYTFSFSNYYNPDRMNFGTLRVLNDDIIEGGGGFDTHAHDNMEIITIPLEGELEHRDSMGNTSVIRQGEIQVMSAGTGIYHSEYNRNTSIPVKLLQIWVFPARLNVEPRYDQIQVDAADRHNKLQQIVAPGPSDEGMWIYQKAWFSLGQLEEGIMTRYKFKGEKTGLYAFVIKGDLQLEDHSLSTRDGLGIWNAGEVTIRAESSSEFLLMEVPMG